MTNAKFEKTLNKAARQSFHLAKRVVKKSKHSRSLAQKLKDKLIADLGEREIYEFHVFYPSIQEYYVQLNSLDRLKKKPLISIIMPTYNTPIAYLKDCIDSVIVQSYPKWELCIADDASSDENVKKILREYASKDKRIKVVERKKNGHISVASNSAIKIAEGEFIALLDHDDVLWPNALYEMAKHINIYPEADLIYSDEDKVDSTGKVHSYPFLKPDWSPEFLESCNYITHFSCIRAAIIRQVGGFRKGYEGAQDWDLFVRVTEKTDNVIHIPKILYSWRIHEQSTASTTDAKPYVYKAQKKLLTDHLKRTNRTGRVEKGIIPQHKTIKYDIDRNSLLTVAVVCADANASKRLVSSLLANEPGANIEILYLVEDSFNGSRNDLKLFGGSISQTIIRRSNFAQDLESIIKNSNGEYILLVKDTLEIVSEDWAKLFVADTQTKNVGLVGPVILDESQKIILSAGVGLGYGSLRPADMLNGTQFDDVHYTRGLYAKSRRDVSAINSDIFASSKSALVEVLRKHPRVENGLELCIKFLDMGYHQVYTPYIQAVSYADLTQSSTVLNEKTEDTYLNPNFNHANPRMEVKSNR